MATIAVTETVPETVIIGKQTPGYDTIPVPRLRRWESGPPTGAPSVGRAGITERCIPRQTGGSNTPGEHSLHQGVGMCRVETSEIGNASTPRYQPGAGSCVRRTPDSDTERAW